MKEHWSDRTEILLGKDKMQRLRDAHVLVVGVGGVGAYAAEMLCRAGVGEMTIIDADTVNITNINRQLPATHATLGRPKVEVLAERFRDINPNVKLHALPMYVAPSTPPEGELTDIARIATPSANITNITEHSKVTTITVSNLLSSPSGGVEGASFDFIVDAIDTIAPKCALIAEALRRGIPIVSSMGAGAKSDITQIRFADLWDTYHCGLAKAVRTRLKKEGLRRPLPVVFSTEQADRRAIITVEGEQNKKSTTGTISYMPAVFGCYLAEYVIRKITMNDERLTMNV